jgi:hypothetical protein
MHEGGSSYSSDRFDIAWGLASNQHRVIVDLSPLDVQGFFSARCANAMGEPESEIAPAAKPSVPDIRPRSSGAEFLWIYPRRWNTAYWR